MVQYPTLGKSKVRNIEIVPLSDTRVLLILVADTGRHEEHVLELGVAVEPEFMAELRSKLNTVLAGAKLNEVESRLGDFLKGFAPTRSGIVRVILEGLFDQVDANRTEKMLLAGTAFLAKSEGDFQRNISPLLETIEEQVVLLKLFSELEADANGIALSIGRENPFEGLTETSVVVGSYENQGSEIAKVGVIGPTRMDYSANIAAVRAIARYLTKALGA
jgi:heat-inducible transcriptional repressor